MQMLQYNYCSCCDTQVASRSRRRRVHWKKLFRALDVAPPEDLTDPDSVFRDQLSQPNKLIAHILDTKVPSFNTNV